MSDDNYPEAPSAPEEAPQAPPAPPVTPSDDEESVTVVLPDELVASDAPGEDDHVSFDAKDLETVAREVAEGKWGVGQERRKALDDAGFDVKAVEEKVSQLLNP